jgi:hypothetical protein
MKKKHAFEDQAVVQVQRLPGKTLRQSSALSDLATASNKLKYDEQNCPNAIKENFQFFYCCH